MYMVVVCHNCGQLLLAKTGQKTKRCPYCGTRLVLRRARKVASAKGSREALNLVQALKKEGRVAHNQTSQNRQSARENLEKRTADNRFLSEKMTKDQRARTLHSFEGLKD